MTTEAQPRTRAQLEQQIREQRAKQERMPAHWVDEREGVAKELEALVTEWLEAEA